MKIFTNSSSGQRFRVRYFEASIWSYFASTTAFQEVDVVTPQPVLLSKLCEQLNRTGMAHPDGKKWIMPGSIASVEITG